jgi:exosortase A-associated hydrolase 2
MGSGRCSISADFLEHSGRKLFSVLLRPPAGDPRGSILFLPPFTEEMHRSRHIVAAQARELAGAGYNVLLLDLYGCGDSGGDFADASWKTWLEDAAFGVDTLKGLGEAPVFLWGLRMGALLACQLARSRGDISELILWQPTLNGEQQIDQFLRLRTVPSSTVSRGNFDRKSLWDELRAGRSLEIAGYELPPRLALEMAKARLNDACPGCPVAWFDIGSLEGRGLPVASESVLNNWRQQGVEVEVLRIPGDPFWRIVEASINSELQHATTAWMQK